MARGNEIIVTANPRGVFVEGYVKTGETFYPGMIVQVDPTVALKGGRHTYKLAAVGADGGRPVGGLTVVTPDNLQGKTASDSYAAGTRFFGYQPIAGEELNVLADDDASGTLDVAAGTEMILQTGTGKVIATTGTPASEPFIALETLTNMTADTLLWVQYSGR
jgi:hypothetical protein